MAPKNLQFFKEEVDGILRTVLVTPFYSAWSFLVMTANNKDGAPTLFVYYLVLNHLMETDRWLISKIQ